MADNTDTLISRYGRPPPPETIESLRRLKIAQRIADEHVQTWPESALYIAWLAFVLTGKSMATFTDDDGQVLDVPKLALEQELLRRLGRMAFDRMKREDDPTAEEGP